MLISECNKTSQVV